MMQLGHNEILSGTTTNHGHIITTLFALHKRLVAVHHQLGGFEDADIASMGQRMNLRWQSACGGLWWCLDYLKLRLMAIEKVLMIVESGSRNGATTSDVLLYPMVDVHFFKQNLAALGAIHDYNQDFSALSRIASRLEPLKLNEGISAEQELSDTESTCTSAADFGLGEEQAIATIFSDAEQVVDKESATGADELTRHRLHLHRKADALQWKSTIPATSWVKCINIPERTHVKASPLAPAGAVDHTKQAAQLFDKTETKLNDTDKLDDNVPEVPISAFHPAKHPGTWTLPPFSALSVREAEGFPSPHQPLHVWAEKREMERQIRLYGESAPPSTESSGDEEIPDAEIDVTKAPSGGVIGGSHEPHPMSTPQSATKVSIQIGTVQADAGVAKDSDGFDESRQYRFSEFNTDNVSKLSRWTDMTSASRLANDLALPVHRVIRLDCMRLKNVLSFKASDTYINAKDRQGLTPLELAITKAGDAPDAAHDLIAAEAEITQPCLGYSNALLAAIRRQKFGLALFMVQKAPSQVIQIINDCDAEGLSPLLLAARFVAQSHYPNTPFEDSPEFNQQELCLALITCGADLNMHTMKEHLTALHFAARHNMLSLVERLVDEKVNVNAGDTRGWTPLHEAVMAGYVPDVVATLVIGGADTNIASRSGVTSLGLAQGWQKLAEAGRLSYKGDTVTIGKKDKEVALREVNSLIGILESRSIKSEDKATAVVSTTAENIATAEASAMVGNHATAEANMGPGGSDTTQDR